MPFRHSIIPALCLLPLLGCDRGSSSAPNSNTETPGHPIIEVSLITPLSPHLQTHFAVDSRGNLYWVQESNPPEPGGDLVYVMGQSGVPQTIPVLASPRILEALGFPNDRSSTGAIRSLVVGPGDSVFVLFTGGSRKLPICAVLRYTPASNKLTVMADTRRVTDASGLGDSLVLAHGSLLSRGTDVWLWLRHTDAGSVVRLIVSENSSTAQLTRLEIKPPPTLAKGPLISDIAKGQLISDHEDLAAGPDQCLYFVDRPRATLWRIDAQGEVTAWQSLNGFSSGLTTPYIESSGTLSFLAADKELLTPRNYLARGELRPRYAASVAWFALGYPAFVQVQPREGNEPLIVNIRRDHFTAPSALRVADMEPHQLLPDPASTTWITFDGSSGELLRLKVSHK